MTEERRPESYMYEETIDLRPYIEALFAWWWLIALCAGLAGAAALLFSILQPSVYEATTRVVVLKSQTEISLGSEFETVTNEDIDLAETVRDVTGRRLAQRLNSMAGLVQNGAIAQQVSEELKGVLTEEERDPSRLLSAVKGRVLQLDAADAGDFPLSDTIEIVVEYDDPEKAAAIANAWSQKFETYVNQIYGDASVTPFTDISQQLLDATDEYEAAKDELLTFMADSYEVAELQRQIEEEQAIIASLRTGRQTAISSIVNKEVETKQQLVDSYLQNDMQNRLFAFNKGQEAKRRILGTWIDAEAANREAAINGDREMRVQLFNEAVNAELEARLGIFQQQQEKRLDDLTTAYTRTQQLEGLLAEARLMREQLNEGWEFSAASTGLPLLALKSRVFSASAGLPFETLDLQVSSIDGLSPQRSAGEQMADLDALIAALEGEIASLETSIAEQSEMLAGGLGYEQLALLDPATTALNATPVTGTMTLAATAPVSETLHDFIAQRYADLFDVGATAQAAQGEATGTPLFAEIETLYPELFNEDAWMALTQAVPDETQMRTLASEAVEGLLQMKGYEDVASAAVVDTLLSEEIARREAEVRQLSAEIERLDSRKTVLEKNRDLAWRTYDALLSKQQELDVAAWVKGSEVRFAAPAVPPRRPVDSNTIRNTALAGVVGMMLGVGFVFVAEYMDMEPVSVSSLLKKVSVQRGG